MTTARPLHFRTLERDEIESIWRIDRRESVERVYSLADGELRLEPRFFEIHGWPAEDVAMMTPLLFECFDRGGRFFAAYDGEQIVGIAVLDTAWLGVSGDLLQLEIISVSRDYRAQGVGGRLFEQVREAARELGARGLYISASRSENTINFYTHRGSTVIETPDPVLFAREPVDIHLECPV